MLVHAGMRGTAMEGIKRRESPAAAPRYFGEIGQPGNVQVVYPAGGQLFVHCQPVPGMEAHPAQRCRQDTGEQQAMNWKQDK
jgi:hypothetical protein